MLKIYNTLTRKKEILKPIKDKKIGIYVCGPTVYSAGHLGHARTYIVFDIIRAWLEKSGYKVKFISNITDVHDDIIKRAKAEKTTIKKISDKFARKFLEEVKILKIKPADKYPRVSEYIPQIIEFIKMLVDKGYAYQKDGSVYFDVSKFKNYGKLSGRKLEQAKAGARVDADKYKKEEAADFALWKKTDAEDKKIGASWPSPWGQGRPGWHIECSAMSKELLGEQFEIHGGARDLIFPHHENEIAQSEAAIGKSPFVKYWLHSGLLKVNKQKMSKSLGNFTTIKDALKKYHPKAIRFWILNAHYRSPIDYTEKNLKQSQAALKKIWDFIDRLREAQSEGCPRAALGLEGSPRAALGKIKKYLNDDFNTSQTLSVIFEIIRKTNKLLDKNKLGKKQAKEIYQFFTETDKILKALIPERKITASQQIKELIRQREEARKKQNWPKADKIRRQIEKKGFVIEDRPKGAKITRGQP